MSNDLTPPADAPLPWRAMTPGNAPAACYIVDANSDAVVFVDDDEPGVVPYLVACANAAPQLVAERDWLRAESLRRGAKIEALVAERDAARANHLESLRSWVAVEKDRDTALARVAALEAQLAKQAADGFVALHDRKAEWSIATFGPGDRYTGVVAHIRKELVEIEAEPTDITEWCDVILLAMDGAMRSCGATGAQLLAAMQAKQTRNEKRAWPDWRTLKPDEVIEHIKKDVTP